LNLFELRLCILPVACFYKKGSACHCDVIVLLEEHVYCKQLVPDKSDSDQLRSIEPVLDDICEGDVGAEEAVKVKQLQLEIRRLKWQVIIIIIIIIIV
jgi:hypothetical protein